MRKLTKYVVLGPVAILVLAACGDGGSGVEPKKDKPDPPDPPKEKVDTFYLSVEVGEGATSSILDGRHPYVKGVSATFTFSAESGYESAIAVLDSAVVDTDGAVALTMNRDHHVLLSAERVLEPVPEASPIAEAVVSFRTAVDSSEVLAKYGEYTERLQELYAEHSFADASAIARTGFATAGETLDYEAYRRSERFLAGQVFGPSGPAGSAGLSSGAMAPTTFIFINGIYTSTDEAELSRLGVQWVVDEAGFGDRVRVLNVYNPSSLELDKLCAAIALYNLSPLGFLKCTGALIDPTEVGIQMASVIGVISPEQEPVVYKLAQLIQLELEAGRRVILLGHSQGTLVVELALQRLLEELGSVSHCLGVIAVGGPFGTQNWATQSLLFHDAFTTKGEITEDLVRWLKQNDLDHITTDLTYDADARMYDRLAMFWSFYELAEDYLLHGFFSYVAGFDSQLRIQAKIGEMLTAFDADPECQPVEPPPVDEDRMLASSEVLAEDDTYHSELWWVETTAEGSDELVGKVTTSDGTGVLLTDVERAPDGTVWGVSYQHLYSIDSETLVATVRLVWPEGFNANALAFDALGRMYVAGEWYLLGLEETQDGFRVFLNRLIGGNHKSLGDLAFAPSGELYATVFNPAQAYQALVRIDLGANEPEVVKRLEKFGNIFGLRFMGVGSEAKLYGLTHSSVENTGRLVTVDHLSGREEFVRYLSFKALGAGVSGR